MFATSAIVRFTPVNAIFNRSVPSARRQAVGARAAMRLPAFIEQLRQQARARLARLRGIPRLHVFDAEPDTEGSWPILLLRLPDAARCEAVLAELWTAGVGVSRMFVHALPDYTYLADRVPQVAMPNARDFASRSLTVSNSLWLDDRTFGDICRVLERVLR
jgi:dTDP-4-amino-4,6-dideoxygalactose transaminase